MEFYIDNDRLLLKTDCGVTITDISSFIELDGGNYDVIPLKNGAWSIKNGKNDENGEKECVATDGVFTLRAFSYGGEVRIRGEVRICGDKKLVDFCPLKGRLLNVNFTRALINTGMGPYNGIHFDYMGSPVGIKAFLREQTHASYDYVAAIYSGGALVAGALDFKERTTCIRLCEDGGVELRSPMYGRECADGEVLYSQEYVLITGENANIALKQYARSLSAVGGVTDNKTRSGWCSWYYYGLGISEKIILDNIAEAKRLGLNLDVFQIDDGWSKPRGDWEPNEKFPRGMKFLADEIKKAGFIPGIWVAPLTAFDNSEFFKNNPDLFVKAHDSDEIFGSNTIDFSNEKAQKWLYDLYRKLSYEWGYRYIKFDFVIYGMSGGRYSKKNWTGVKNYQKALEIMRSAVTEDTLLLACTAPMCQSVGAADILRTSVDIFEQWSSLKTVARQVLNRSFLNYAIKIDPDCLLVRTAEHEDDEAFRRCTRTKQEIKTFASFMAATGGNVMFSDKLSLLTSDRVDLMKKLLPVNQTAVIPADICERDIPSVLITDCGERGVKTVTLINWGDYPEVITHELDKQYSAFDFWEQKPLGKLKTLSFNIPAHECKVIHLTCDLPIIGFYDRIIPDIKFDISDAAGGEYSLKGLKAGEKLLLNEDFSVENLSGGQIDGQTVTVGGGNLKLVGKERENA